MDDIGNLVALPLQGQALKVGNSAFIDENWNAFENQWECLKNITRISLETIEKNIKDWCTEGIYGVLGNEYDLEEKKEDKENEKPWEKIKYTLYKDDVVNYEAKTTL